MLKKFVMITIYLVLGYQAKGSYNIEAIIDMAPVANMTVATVIDRAPASNKEIASIKKAKPRKMKNICSIQAGDVGKLKYKGKTYEQAFSKVTDACFQRRTDLYVKARKRHPDQDRQIQFAESCVNSVKCI